MHYDCPPLLFGHVAESCNVVENHSDDTDATKKVKCMITFFHTTLVLLIYPPIVALMPYCSNCATQRCCVSCDGAAIGIESGLYCVPNFSCFPLPIS